MSKRPLQTMSQKVMQTPKVHPQEVHPLQTESCSLGKSPLQATGFIIADCDQGDGKLRICYMHSFWQPLQCRFLVRFLVKL